MELKRVDEGEKGFEKVFAFLRDRLLAGSLKPGDRLVSERDLAIQLGVSRPLVREALRALTMLGHCRDPGSHRHCRDATGRLGPE